MAEALGADEVFDARVGLPCDIAFVVEASGVAAALGGVLRATARGGTVVQVGNLPITPTPAALGDLVSREITWIGSYRFVDEITEAVAVLAGGLDVTPLIAAEFDLADAATAIDAAAATAGKVLLRLG